MDYGQKYKEALKKAKAMIKVAANQDEAIGFANTIFPELKESDYEKIRKGIIKYLSWIKDRDGSYMPNNIPFDDMIAWLEKQGEKPQGKTYIFEGKSVLEAINKEKVEPKFKAFDYENANIQQKDFAPKSHRMVSAWAKEALYGKPVWSEEDEKMYLSIMSVLLSTIGTDKTGFTVTREMNWLKSLKDRYTWKPSDEQIEVLEALVEDNNQRYFYTTLNSLYEQLKKLMEG